MSHVLEPQSSQPAKQPKPLWPIAMLIFAIVFGPAVLAWVLMLLAH